MKSSVALLLFGLVFVATTSARPHDSESDLTTFDEEGDLEHSIAQNRDHIRRQRRRHSRQAYDRQGDNGLDNSINKPEEDDDDEGRPISFQHINTNNAQSRPSPPVEHGSVQAGLTTETTTTAKPTKKLPGICDSAIIMCCRFPKDAHKECFKKYGCSKTFDTGFACLPNTLKMIIQRFIDAFAPK